MKVKALLLFFMSLLVSPVAFATDSADAQNSDTAPVISFAETEFDFGTAVEGTIIEHTFVVQNRGASPLKIEKILAACGCTTADYTKEAIAPGKSGHVTIELNTKGYGGKHITKRAAVHSNDPAAERVDLMLVGKVTSVVDISPKKIVLAGAPGEKLESVVTITPSEAFPFHIIGAPEKEKDTYRCELEEKDGKYILTAQNLATEPATYFDTVVLKTDNAEMPEIKISVIGVLRTEEADK